MSESTAPLSEREALLVNKWVGRVVGLGLAYVAANLPVFHGFAEVMAAAVTLALTESVTDLIVRAKVWSKATVDRIRARLA
jgi:hypothetical protein